MDNKNTEVLIERVNELMNKQYLKKKDVAEKLGMEYLAFWRRLKGKRGVDINFLSKLAFVLGTSVSYLMGETDNANNNNIEHNEEAPRLPMNILPLKENSKEMLYQETPGQLVFECGDIHIKVPDTPSNQDWFRIMAQNYLMHGGSVKK